MNSTSLQQKSFLLLLVLVTVAFFGILMPFFGAVFWGSVLAIVFTPMFRWLLARMGRRRNLAALSTLLLCLVVVILPLAVVAGSLARQGALVYANIQNRQLDAGEYVQQIVSALPAWVVELLERVGLGDFEAMKQRLSEVALQAGQLVAAQALNITQNTLDFVVGLGIMMYLLYFLLRDGAGLLQRIHRAVPLTDQHKRHLAEKFTTVIRATVKGNIVVAALQGALGGVALWALGVQAALLWGVLMALLSLLPAVGAALIWAPVALYFLATGMVWKGVVLIAFGVLVIGLVDNIMRPLLVGKDTQMPDYLVLISTLGGIGLLGLNGFVIGPVIAALFIAVWDLFSTMREDVAVAEAQAEARADAGRLPPE